jgi:spore germination protein YaaH
LKKRIAIYILKVSIFFLLFGFYQSAFAATKSIVVKQKAINTPSLEISAWIPYWRQATGTTEAIAHIASFKEISPFGYTVKLDGTLFDAMKINQDPWPALIADAKSHKVKVIPTVMWSNADTIDAILRNPKTRAAHVKAIVAMVKSNNFDGVDIDYEGKKAETEKYFSLFLHDLWYAIGNKVVSCTIEARTPLTSRFDVVPTDVQYANDYTAINKYCDRVRIMTYDQGTVDLRLNETAQGPYSPVADTQWVEKVIKLAEQTISKKKIVIGVATYGYAYDVQPLQGGGYVYDRITTFDPNYALAIASQFNIIPQRNSAGELSFTYMPTSTPSIISSNSSATTSASLDTSTFTQTSVTNSLGSTTLSNVSTAPPLRMLWWSDASAIKDKITLAKKLGVRGIVIFKLDGGADPGLWNVLQ